jgi:hypothetical protein
LAIGTTDQYWAVNSQIWGIYRSVRAVNSRSWAGRIGRRQLTVVLANWRSSQVLVEEGLSTRNVVVWPHRHGFETRSF